MALMTRVARLFRADVHAVLDRLEEPDVLLRQAIREMEESLAADRDQARRMARELDAARARVDETARALAAIETELDTCFTAGRDDLARAAVRRRLETTRLADLLARRAEGIEQALAAQRARIDDNAARLAEMQAKAALFEATDHDEPRGGTETPVRSDEVEVAFLAEQHRRRPS